MIREKIAEAYRNSCKTYEDLLEMVASVDEEFLEHFSSSPMQYLKNGCQFDKRLVETAKRSKAVAEASDTSNAAPSDSSSSESSQDSNQDFQGLKRMKL